MPAVIDLSSDDDGPSGLPGSSLPIPSTSQRPVVDLSSREGSDDALPDFEDALNRPFVPQKRRLISSDGEMDDYTLPRLTSMSKGKGRAVESPLYDDDSDTETEAPAKKPKRKKLTDEDKAERAAEKEEAKKRKAEEREAARLQKEIDKENRKNENQANKLSGSRTDTLHEMRILFAESLVQDRTFGPYYGTIKDQLKEGKIGGVSKWGTIDSPKVIKWQRNSSYSWDHETRRFKTHPNNEMRIEDEATILLFIQHKELTGIENLLKTVAEARRLHGGSNVQVFVLVDGLQKIKKQDKSDANREKDARLDGRPAPARKNTGPTAEEYEMALVRLQLIEKCFVLQPKSSNESIRWVVELTKDIGARRKRSVEKSHLARLGIDGGRPTMNYQKNDLKRGYVAMLTSLYHIGEGFAEGIARQYPTLRKLYEAFERYPPGPQRDNMLAGIEKGKNKDGTKSSAKMGPGISKRICKQLFEQDPSAMMVRMTKGKETSSKGGRQATLDFD